MEVGLRQSALDAHRAGDSRKVRDIILSMQHSALNDVLLLQLLALASHNRADEHALLRYAAVEVGEFDASAFFNLGVVEQQMGLLDHALLRYEQALRLEPTHHGALNNLSDLLRRRGRSADAWRRISIFLESGGDPAGLETRVAKIADDCGEASAAREWFARAVERAAGDQTIVWEQAMQQLRDEEFDAGWLGYEARRTIFQHQSMGIVSYGMPEWDGMALGDCSLLIHKEQGLGDTIMFASCLADLPVHHGELHLAVQPPLTRLFMGNFPNARVWSSTSTPGLDDENHQTWRSISGDIDLHLPFGSLPRRVRSKTFPAPRAYLSATKTDEDIWCDRLARLAPGSEVRLRAGLVITARRDGSIGPGIAEGLPKSLPAQLAGRLAVPGIEWFGLHNPATASDLASVPDMGVLDMSEWLFDLADTAGLIAQLDVVVAVDTVVAHLAGAMGKKVLLMLRRLSDWRWGRTRTDSYWYPDVEIFRQAHEGDWTPVVASVAARLREITDANLPNVSAAQKSAAV